MIEQIKNPLYPDFSDREIVAVEDDFSIHLRTRRWRRQYDILNKASPLLTIGDLCWDVVSGSTWISTPKQQISERGFYLSFDLIQKGDNFVM